MLSVKRQVVEKRAQEDTQYLLVDYSLNMCIGNGAQSKDVYL